MLLPAVGARRVLVGADDGTVHVVRLPIELARPVRGALEHR